MNWQTIKQAKKKKKKFDIEQIIQTIIWDKIIIDSREWAFWPANTQNTLETVYKMPSSFIQPDVQAITRHAPERLVLH